MRGGKRKKGGDPAEESRERGAHRGEEKEREVAHRVRVRELHAEDVGTGRHRRLHFLGNASGNLHHKRDDVLGRTTVDKEILRERARRQQETSHVRWWTRPKAWRRLVANFFPIGYRYLKIPLILADKWID